MKLYKVGYTFSPIPTKNDNDWECYVLAIDIHDAIDFVLAFEGCGGPGGAACLVMENATVTNIEQVAYKRPHMTEKALQERRST